MSGGPGSVRIIGGRWRRTRVAVAASEALRPTSDRVRETLFNWLAPVIEGARCLDLYAGSGVLGFEAVSRGARAATLVDDDPAAVRVMQALAGRLGAHEIEICRAEALGWLRAAPRAYDIVFVDPPFGAGLLEPTLALLGAGWLAPAALVYVEAPAKAPPLPAGWTVTRSGATRQVRYALLSRSS